jgi:tetratricopeptide (TPR) repeat protein
MMTTTDTNSHAGGTGHRPLRQLWQAPVFCMGLAALVSVCAARPTWRDAGDRQLERDLAKARQLLEQPRPNPEQALSVIEKLLDKSGSHPDRAAEIHFLAGWAHARAGGVADAAEALDDWRQARNHLEQAQALGVGETDRLRLICLLGKAWYHTHGDLRQTIDYLESSVESGDDNPPEAYALLTQAYLKLPTPDVAAALRANEKQLAWPNMDEAVLAPARLLRGELLLQSHRPDEARKVLASISAQAPAEIHARARHLRACSYEEEGGPGNLAEAAKLWEEARQDKLGSTSDRVSILYKLGLCYRRLNKLPEAASVWQECTDLGGPGDEGQAACLGLAELRIAENHSPLALDAFARGVRNINAPADWHNALVTLTDARQAFERGSTAYCDAGDYDSAIQLARLYEKLSPPGTAQQQRARAAEAWARLKKEEAAKKAGSPASEDALALFRQAGEAYQLAAELAPTPDVQIDSYWQSAACFVEGQDSTRALPVLEKVVTLPLDSARLGEAWYMLGETRHELKDEQNALDAYRRCIEHQTVFALRARYHLAMAEKAANHIDAARTALEQNLSLLHDDGDTEALDKTLAALADLEFAGGDYRDAALHLERLLQTFPDTPAVLRRRQRLADCYHLLADKEVKTILQGGDGSRERRVHAEEQYRRNEEKAAELYQCISDALGKLKVDKGLDKDQEESFLRAAFAAAECRYNLGDYPQAVGLYQQLQSYYQGKVEELNALAGLARCNWSQGGAEGTRKALEAVEKIRTILPTLKDAEFDRGPGSWDRAKWEEWLRDVMRRSEQP